MRFIFWVTACSFLLGGCRKEGALPYDAIDDRVAPHLLLVGNFPDHAPELSVYWAAGLTGHCSEARKAQRGGVLFCDWALSSDGKVSCEPCNLPELTFGYNLAFSRRMEGHLTRTNTLPLSSSVWFSAQFGLNAEENTLLPLFWGSRFYAASDQCMGAFAHSDALGRMMGAVVSRVRYGLLYPELFEQAWGETVVSEPRILKASSHFADSKQASLQYQPQRPNLIETGKLPLINLLGKRSDTHQDS